MSFISRKETRNLTDLEGSDYLRHPLPHSERVKHLESWFREALTLPFAYNATIDSQGNFVSYGQKMVEINDHALEVRRGQVGEARVQAEKDGVVALEKLLNKSQPGDTLFLFSPPGLTEEGFGQKGERRLSFTYVFQVFPGTGEDIRSIRAVAIPTPEITPETHLRQFVETYGKSPVMTLPPSERELNDRFLVSAPILVTDLSEAEQATKLTSYTELFARKPWQQIEAEIEGGLKLKDDEQAEGRRRSLIQSISWHIGRFVEERNAERLNNIGEAARIVLVREAVGHYAHMTPEALLAEYAKTENALWLQRDYQQASETRKAELLDQHGAAFAVATLHLESVVHALRNDSQASEILAASSCGGGGVGETLNGLFSRFGNIVTGRGHLLERQLEAMRENANKPSGSEDMKCVTCPFCSATVDAIVTSTHIECPACHQKVAKD